MVTRDTTLEAMSMQQPNTPGLPSTQQQHQSSPHPSRMASVMATGPMKLAPRTDGIIEATAPEAEPRLSTEVGHFGYAERKYGLDARVTPGITFEEYRHWAKIERQLEVNRHHTMRTCGSRLLTCYSSRRTVSTSNIKVQPPQYLS